MRIALFVFFAIIILIAFFSIDNKKIQKKFKIIIVIVLFILLVFAYFFEKITDEKADNASVLARDFMQGKNLVCKGIEVNNVNFDFSYSTMSLIAKKDAPQKFKNLMFEIKECSKNEK